ncbi:MAG: DUF1922 domain-containing protein [Candidatus Bathyarchaeia archaeon]|nr:DUF1922 domain-containing protein [Candidatus Bathyarchaeota archaeon]
MVSNRRRGFIIVRCPYCSNLSIAKISYRSRSCSFCGRRFTISQATIVKYADDARMASEIVRSLKKRLRV